MRKLILAAILVSACSPTIRAQWASSYETDALQTQLDNAKERAREAEDDAEAARRRESPSSQPLPAPAGPSANEIATAIVTKQREDKMAEEWAKAQVEREDAAIKLKQAEQQHREWQERAEAAAARQRSDYAKAHPSDLFQAQLAAQRAAEDRAFDPDAWLAAMARAEEQRPLVEAKERARRFAPDGTVYNLVTITVVVGKKKVVVAPETELRLIRKNADGTVHVQTDSLEADVPSADVTNDRDWMRAYRTLHAGEDH